MAERGDPQVLRFVVIFLRTKAGMSQVELGRAARLTQGQISRAELGIRALPEEALGRIAKVAEVSWPVVMHLRRFIAAALSTRNAAESSALDTAVLDSALLAAMAYLVEQSEEGERETPEEIRREADEIWAALEPLPGDERRRRIEMAPANACRCWAALAARAAEEGDAELAALIAGRPSPPPPLPDTRERGA